MAASPQPQLLTVLIKALENDEIRSAFNLASELRWLGTYVRPDDAPVDLSSHSLILKPILTHADIEAMHEESRRLNFERAALLDAPPMAGSGHYQYAVCFREALIAKLKELANG